MGKNYRHLDLTDRCEIYRLRADGISLSRIARTLGRSTSTISRELKRNVLTPWSSYRPDRADRMSWARKLRGSKLERLAPLREYVLERLAMGLSPEQICGRATLEETEHKLTPETLYTLKHYMHGFIVQQVTARSFTNIWYATKQNVDAELSASALNRLFRTVGQYTSAQPRPIQELKLGIGRRTSCISPGNDSPC